MSSDRPGDGIVPVADPPAGLAGRVDHTARATPIVRFRPRSRRGGRDRRIPRDRPRSEWLVDALQRPKSDPSLCEDALETRRFSPEHVLVVVADGASNPPGGRAASHAATAAFVRSVVGAFETARLDGPAEASWIEQVTKTAFVEADRAVLNAGSASGNAGMSTTFTALLTSRTGFTVAHIGDSRLWALYDDEIVDVTPSHGEGKFLTSALRGDGILGEPFFATVEIDDEVCFAIASDGLEKCFPVEQLRDALATAATPAALSSVSAAHRADPRDDLSLVVLRRGPRLPPPPRRWPLALAAALVACAAGLGVGYALWAGRAAPPVPIAPAATVPALTPNCFTSETDPCLQDLTRRPSDTCLVRLAEIARTVGSGDALGPREAFLLEQLGRAVQESRAAPPSAPPRADLRPSIDVAPPPPEPTPEPPPPTAAPTCSPQGTCENGLACYRGRCLETRCVRSADCSGRGWPPESCREDPTDKNVPGLRCRPTTRLGGYCDTGVNCDTGRCEEGMCVLVPEGGACRTDAQCRSPLVCGTADGKKQCAPAPAPAPSGAKPTRRGR